MSHDNGLITKRQYRMTVQILLTSITLKWMVNSVREILILICLTGSKVHGAVPENIHSYPKRPPTQPSLILCLSCNTPPPPGSVVWRPQTTAAKETTSWGHWKFWEGGGGGLQKPKVFKDSQSWNGGGGSSNKTTLFKRGTDTFWNIIILFSKYS